MSNMSRLFGIKLFGSLRALFSFNIYLYNHGIAVSVDIS